MAYEVDILAVGDESKSGDAIALRFGNFTSNPADQAVAVIDGGFKESGEKLVERIRTTYGSNKADIVVSTHPDMDHVSGLNVVLEEMEVGELWMHRPWTMSASILRFVDDRRMSALGLSSRLRKSLEGARDLEQLALRKGITIRDPFQGLSAFDNRLYVLGPSKEFYQALVADFEKSAPFSASLAERAKALIREWWHQDELVDPAADAVSARNNSSVIVLANLDDKHFMFVGDAGVPALNHAADYAEAHAFPLSQKLHYFHVPHHGSKRNLGPTVLDRIIGPKVTQGTVIGKTAFISAAKASDKHPSKRVTNALLRRGMHVTATCGQDHCFRSLDVPQRPGWEPITAVTFCHEHEEDV